MFLIPRAIARRKFTDFDAGVETEGSQRNSTEGFSQEHILK